MKLSEIETTVGNKLIINFMENSVIKWRPKNYHCFEEHYINIDRNIVRLSEFKFHSSWDSLKPVIDKIIKQIGFKCIDECSREEWHITTNVTRMHIGVSIEEAYIYVIEYINFYNKQKKNGK